MSSVKNAIDSFSGGKQGAKAVKQAANIQKEYGEKSIDFQKESRDLARGDLQPFREAGQSALSGLQNLVNDPNAQLDFVQNNPFFNNLANQAQNNLMKNSAAKGKVGSGGTAEALQNSLMLLGNDLVGQSINQRYNLATLGANAASGQANVAQQTGVNIGNTLGQIGNTQAAGVIGANNAVQEGRQNSLSAGGEIGGALVMASDIRVKENIKEVGKLNNGLPVYLFNYKGDEKIHMNVMAQDVEQVNPDAVTEIDGVKYVKMNKIY